MEPIALSKGLFVKLLNFVPKFFFRWYWNEKRLGSKIRIDLRPRNNPIEIWHDPPKLSVWLEIVNLGPFTVELDRLEFRMNVAGAEISATRIEPVQIPYGSIYSLYLVESAVPDTTLMRLAKVFEKVDSPTSMFGYAVFKSGIRDFRRDFHLEGIYNIRFVNFPRQQ